MSIIVRRLGLWGCVALVACSGASGDDGANGSESDGSSPTTNASDGSTAAMPGATGSSAADDEADLDGSGNANTSSPGSDTAGASTTSGGSDSTGGDPAYDEEFMWVADFMRTNCVTCHATNMNGNLVLGSVEITNEEVRIALDGVAATTGLLLVEPFDRAASQTYLQITNEFGAQFPIEDTDRFGAWIDAGAPYFAR